MRGVSAAIKRTSPAQISAGGSHGGRLPFLQGQKFSQGHSAAAHKSWDSFWPAPIRRKSAKAEVFTCTAFVLQRRFCRIKEFHLAPGLKKERFPTVRRRLSFSVDSTCFTKRARDKGKDLPNSLSPHDSAALFAATLAIVQ